ncbi:MAG: hypothetical protein M1816_006271 [Peltula sp. TS41687]|nr:MAG: hypothetical protein M1816_006271 [Peltula sp. TS41687]
MDITNILNRKGSSAAAAMLAVTANPDHQLQRQLARVPRHSPSDSDSDPAGSSYGSETSSRYSSRTASGFQAMTSMPEGLRYPSPTAMQNPLPMLQDGLLSNDVFETGPVQTDFQAPARPQMSTETPKAFPCSSCGKGFARRSDLARHERIHTGVRPHVCDYPGCEKQFIQRSALTVHARVHTGEKPHMCERCGKPFSDSSSLARHRRIHSGKRPYKCPYADCQKTFTRRTTLTRHQNHHSGTVEEAALATAAALASRPPVGRSGRPTRSDGGEYSQDGSPLSTPSPAPRPISLSPSAPLPSIPHMHRHHGDFTYISTGQLPPHIRSDMRQMSPRSSPSATPNPMLTMAGRPTLHTSHPTGFGPPPILEPPANPDQRQAGSVSGSPHMSGMGWQSPSHGGMIPQTHADGYIYPDQFGAAGLAGTHLYYPDSNMRRPQNTDPQVDGYDVKQRLGGEVWTTSVS